MESNIDIMELFFLLWGHLWQAILCLIIGGAIAFGYTYYKIPPTYRTTAKIYMVSNSGNSLISAGDLSLGATLATDYKDMIMMRPLLEDASRNLGLNWSAAALASHISVTNPANSRLLHITVTDTNPFRAADIANEMANQAVVYLPMFMECKAPTIAETALVPTRKAGPNITQNTMQGAAVGFIGYCGILVLIYMLNDTLVTPDDVEKYFGVQPLSTIPEGDLGAFSKKKKKKRRKKKRSNRDREG